MVYVKAIHSMTDEKKIPTSGLIAKGYLTVNIPTTIIILAIWIGLWKLFDLYYLISLMLGTLTGWYYWAYSVRKWIQWAHKNQVSPDRILQMGRLGFLLWRKKTITDALENEGE